MTYIPTSAAVFRAALNCGYLSAKRQQVYEAHYNFGPHTQREMWIYTNSIEKSKSYDSSHSSLTSRYSELLRQGAMEIIGKRYDPGNYSYVWAVSDNIPIKYVKPDPHFKTLAVAEHRRKLNWKELAKKFYAERNAVLLGIPVARPGATLKFEARAKKEKMAEMKAWKDRLKKAPDEYRPALDTLTDVFCTIPKCPVCSALSWIRPSIYYPGRPVEGEREFDKTGT